MLKRVLTNNFRVQRTWLKGGGIALFLLWLFYTLSAYYVVEKPISVPLIVTLRQESDAWLHFTFSIAAVGRTLLDLGAALWLTLIALGVGLQLLNILSLSPESNLETALYALGLGFGFLGLWSLFLGLAGLLQTAIFYGTAVLLTLLTAGKTFSLLRRLRLPRLSPLISLYLFLTIILALTVALLPPTSWDGLFYHLKGPKLYLEAGRIQPGIDIPHLNFPSLMEMLFMMAMAIRGDVAAQLLHFVFNFMLAGLVYSLSLNCLRLRNSWIAILFLYTIPMVLTLASWAYNDLALAFYQVVALYALLHWQRVRQQKWLILSGILCGLAMGLKYTSFVAPLFLAGVIIWLCRQRLRTAVRPLLLIVLPMVVVATPWYVKNLLFTGNPTYPFLFGGHYWDEFRAAAYAGPGTGIGLDPIALLRLPHDLTLGLQDASQDGPTGPFFLVFLPFLLAYGLSRLGRQAPPAFRLLLLFALVQYAFWTIGVIFSAGLWQSRLLLPAFVALCPALAWLWQDLERFDQPQFSLHQFLKLTIALSLVLNLVGQVTTWLPQRPLAYVLGKDSRDEVLLRHLGVHYLAMAGINKQLPADAVVTFLWEPRSYYCERDCRPDSILDKFGHLEYLYGDAIAIANAWREEGVTHVLLYQTGLDFVMATGAEWIAPHDISILRDLQAQELQPVANWGDAYILYELQP